MRDDVATAVAAFPALEIIAIAAITNDIRQPVGLPDVAVDQVLQITRSIQLQVQFIQNNWPDLKIMVLQCPPLGISARSSDETNTSRFAINDWIATYGAGVGFIPVLCYEPLLDVDPPGDDGINGDSSFYTDDIHYSAAGHVVVGAAVDLALAPHV
jgi:lysophospholipase L1-like esterase